MRVTPWIALLAAAGLLAAAPAPAAEALGVIATTPDLAAIAAAVGGDAVAVESIARGYQDPHYVQAKPSYMRRLNRADLLIYNGLELEIGWLPLLVQGSRNPRVQPGTAGSLDASSGVPILEVPSGQVDRSMGDVHPEGNPHYTLDPRRGLLVATAVAARLEELAPERAADIAARLAAFRAALEDRITGWEERLAPYRGTRIVASHKQWEYLADWLGLEISGYVEEKPGVPPAPRHVAALVERMRALAVPLVIHANFVDPTACERVAGRTGAAVLSLPASVGGEEGLDEYADLFETIVTRLAANLDPLEGAGP